MNMRKTSGFTIIEVMLFLAITGLLIAGILGGTTQSLNSQRYRSGVEDLRNTIRSQYETALSLRNLTADATGNVTTSDNSIDPCSDLESGVGASINQHTYRGASNCLYVGRLILIDGDTIEKISRLTVYPVIAKVETQGVSGIFTDAAGNPLPAPADGDATDAGSLRIAAFTKNKNIVTRDQVDWGLVAVTPKPAERYMHVGLLVFRSPISGALTTYVISDTDTQPPDYLSNLQNYLDPSDNMKDVKMCMADFGGSLDQTHRMAIVVHAGATGPGDVETLGEAAKC